MGQRIQVLMAMVLSLSILLCGCNSDRDDVGSTDINSAVSEDILFRSIRSNDTETSAVTPKDVPSQSISSNDFTELTDEEISWFNTEFFNSSDISEHPEQYIHNMLLSSTYETAAEIDLFELFYGGVGWPSSALTEKELELLAEYCGDDAHMLDVAVADTEEMNEILRKHLNLCLEETEQRGLDQFVYLKDYDRYYNVVGDTHYQFCSVISGYRNADGMIILQYEMGGKQYEVTLLLTDECYLFVSNLDL